MAKARNTAFFCKECGYESAKWLGLVKADQDACEPHRVDFGRSSVFMRDKSRHDPQRDRARKAGCGDHRLDPDNVPGRYLVGTWKREPGPGIDKSPDADRKGIRDHDLYRRPCDERGRCRGTACAGTYGGYGPLL